MIQPDKAFGGDGEKDGREEARCGQGAKVSVEQSDGFDVEGFETQQDAVLELERDAFHVAAFSVTGLACVARKQLLLEVLGTGSGHEDIRMMT